MLGNIRWIVLFGRELFFAHVVAGLLLMLTIIGIPFGFASLKLSVLALVPLGTRVVDADTPWALPQYRNEPAYR